MVPRAASNPHYCKSDVDFCVEIKSWGKKLVIGKEKEDKNNTRKEKMKCLGKR